MPSVSRTNQWPACCVERRVARRARASASPAVFSTQVPISSSLVRRCRIASSSSRAICSGHQRGAGGLDRRRRRSAARRSAPCTVSVAVRARAVDRDVDVLVVIAVVVDRALRAASARRPCASAGRSLCAASAARALAARAAANCCGLATSSTSRQSFARLAAHAFGGGAEDVGEVAAHLALVGHARQAAGAGQHAEQRHFGQAHGGGAVVDQHDLVAGERQLVAAAGAGAVQRGEELQARVRGWSPRCRCASRW